MQEVADRLAATLARDARVNGLGVSRRRMPPKRATVIDLAEAQRTRGRATPPPMLTAPALDAGGLSKREIGRLKEFLPAPAWLDALRALPCVGTCP